MKAIDGISLDTVRAVYSGPEAELWELIMGEQIHAGGMASSQDLAAKAGIRAGARGIDLCCCTGAGMRFLLRMYGVASMTGVDATAVMIERGVRRNREAGFESRISFVQRDVCDTGLPNASADFIWGEDAWCYVVDKSRLIAEAVRLVKPGGTIAFTDWIEGDVPLTDAEAKRLLAFMKFPNIQDLSGYSTLLRDNGCEIVAAQDTGRFARCMDLYLSMVEQQLAYDVLRILGFDRDLVQTIAGEMQAMQKLAHAGKILQGLFVARKLD